MNMAIIVTRSTRSKPFMLVLQLTILFLFTPEVLSQSKEEPTTSSQPERAWFNKSTHGRRDTTSAMLLQRLQQTRPFNAAISSKRSLELQAKGVPPALLPEGTRLVDSIGFIKLENKWWLFHSTSDDHEEPLRMLPSEWLETMIRSGTDSTEPILYRMSGEVTEYEGRNYVLVHAASRREPQPSEKISFPHNVEVAADAPIDDVVARLRAINPQQQLLSPADNPFPPMPKFVTSMLPSVRPEGTPMIRRPGRLIQEGPWWTFVLETSSLKQDQLPIKMLPNHNVELMVDTISHGAEGVVFLVSGQLTLFNGENYLFPQAVTRQVDIGNLRK